MRGGRASSQLATHTRSGAPAPAATHLPRMRDWRYCTDRHSGISAATGRPAKCKLARGYSSKSTKCRSTRQQKCNCKLARGYRSVFKESRKKEYKTYYYLVQVTNEVKSLYKRCTRPPVAVAAKTQKQNRARSTFQTTSQY